jgi:hypothetical protein
MTSGTEKVSGPLGGKETERIRFHPDGDKLTLNAAKGYKTFFGGYPGYQLPWKKMEFVHIKKKI